MSVEPIQQTSDGAMARELSCQPSLFALCMLAETEKTEKITSRLEIQALLDEFQTLFRTLDSLPPARKIDHHIDLRDGN